MRGVLSTHGPRGDVEPIVGLALQQRALGTPPDCAEMLAAVDVPPVVVFGGRR